MVHVGMNDDTSMLIDLGTVLGTIIHMEAPNTVVCHVLNILFTKQCTNSLESSQLYTLTNYQASGSKLRSLCYHTPFYDFNVSGTHTAVTGT
jgi:hypothetical protein